MLRFRQAGWCGASIITPVRLDPVFVPQIVGGVQALGSAVPPSSAGGKKGEGSCRSVALGRRGYVEGGLDGGLYSSATSMRESAISGPVLITTCPAMPHEADLVVGILRPQIAHRPPNTGKRMWKSTPAHPAHISPGRYIHTGDADEYLPIPEVVEELVALEVEARDTDAALKAILARIGV